ncbi:MAG: ATP-binding protein [Janthinobacterium lividum]
MGSGFYASPLSDAPGLGLALPHRHAVTGVPSFSLTPEERAWLHSLPELNFAADERWPPFSYLDAQGRPSGVASDYLRIVQQALGLRLRYVSSDDWSQILKESSLGQLDLVVGMLTAEEWAPWLVYSQSFEKSPAVIVTRLDNNSVTSMKTMVGKRIGVLQGSRLAGVLTQHQQPGERVVDTWSVQMGLAQVAAGSLDAFVGSVDVLDPLVRSDFAGKLKIGGGIGIDFPITFGVSRRYAHLAELISRVLAAIPERSRQRIRSRWMTVHYYDGLDWSRVLRLGGPPALAALVCLGSFLFSHFRLRQEVQRRRLAEVRLTAHAAALTEAKLVAESAARARSEFLSTMSHEIRTPMNGVLGMLELLGLTHLDADQSRMLRVVRTSANGLLRILDDILDLAKIESGRLTIDAVPVNLRDVIGEVMSVLEANACTRQLYLYSTVDPALKPLIMTDDVRLRQILFNLVGNALKFTEHGGVEIAVEVLTATRRTQRLAVEVRDTGIGIQKNQQSQLFEPFVQADASTTRRYGGSGLGLAICRHLAGLMGGTISLQSELGVGTVVRVELPVRVARIRRQRVSGNAVCSATETPCEAPPRRPAHLLLAEDHPIARDLLTRQLGQLGYTFEFAANGRAALTRLAQRRFDALLTDCQMPELDGYELTRQWRAMEALRGPVGGRLVIIGMTANALREDQARREQAGMDDCLIKPIRLATLETTLRRWLDVNDMSDAVGLDATRRRQWSRRDRLLSKTFGSRALAAQVVAAFVGAGRDDLQAFALASERLASATPPEIPGSLETLASLAHRIAGGVQLIGERALGTRGVALEESLRAGTVDPLEIRLFHEAVEALVADIDLQYSRWYPDRIAYSV